MPGMRGNVAGGFDSKPRSRDEVVNEDEVRGEIRFPASWLGLIPFLNHDEIVVVVVVVAPIPKLRDRYIRRRVYQFVEFGNISDVDVGERKRRKKRKGV